ncbi:WbqC family protein [Methylobacterium sp. SD21]|uniref:WbqC family protein n=1 Tax=Methylobacterium litchii TaxID=3138810 RepID=UPI00313E88A4
MRVAIMQPYLFPYIGYFQLIASVDRFVIYDAVKYTKKGWINRNRFLRDGEAVTFTLPLARGADELDIAERQVAGDFAPDKLCAQIAGAYRRAPSFAETMPLVEAVLRHRAENLFLHLREGLTRTCAHLGIATPILTASEIEGRTDLRKQDRVLGLCERLGATTYVNPIGGTALYDPQEFEARGMELRFLKARPLAYPQFGAEFVPWLSIIDVLMFNGREGTRAMLGECDLLAHHEAAPAGLPEAA